MNAYQLTQFFWFCMGLTSAGILWFAYDMGLHRLVWRLAECIRLMFTYKERFLPCWKFAGKITRPL